MSRSILLVDDDPDIRNTVGDLLRMHGYRVECAAGGRAALERFAGPPPLPDLILLDVAMPDMSGFEVLRRIRSDPATSRVPVVMVTAQTGDDDVMSGYRDGADYYVAKPCTLRQLLYGIRLLLGERVAPVGAAA